MMWLLYGLAYVGGLTVACGLLLAVVLVLDYVEHDKRRPEWRWPS